MPIELISNQLVPTTLSGAITNSDTSFSVVSATGLPSTGNFRLLLSDGVNLELVLVGARSGTALSSITRGIEGTAASAFASGSTVILAMTAAALTSILASASRIGAYSSLPADADGREGDQYRCIDTDYVYHHNGSIWVPFYQNRFPATVPPTSSWTFNNQGGSSVATSNGALAVTWAGSANQFRLYTRSAPGTPYTLTVRMLKYDHGLPTENGTVADGMGIAFSDGTKFSALYALTQYGSNNGVIMENWNTVSSYSGGVGIVSGVPATIANIATAPILHLRIRDDGTTLYYSYSADGFYWTLLTSHSRTSHMGSGPSLIGLCSRNIAATQSFQLVYDWSIT